MGRLDKRFPVYNKLLRLYPIAYQKAYRQQMLQTYADMLHDAASPADKLAVRLRLILDLPLSVTRQQLSNVGGIMTNEMPTYVKRNALLSGLLLLPFMFAVATNVIDQLVNQQTLYQSWAWGMPVIAIWVLCLPLVAAVIAGASWLIYLAQRTHATHKSFLKTALEIQYTWPLLLVIAGGLFILAVLFGHDSVHCFLGNPVHTVQHLHEAINCAQNS